MRVVSLLPAATEIMALLGQLDLLVAVSHECDYPAAVMEKPRATRSLIENTGSSSADIDRRVREALASSGTLYAIDARLLRDLQPNLILTQALCDVCAVGYGSVRALAETLPTRPQIVNFEPNSLEDVLENIERLGRLLHVADRADLAVSGLRQRLAFIDEKLGDHRQRPPCFLMEWIDPPFCSGHWVPELVELAGGSEPLGRKWQPSARIHWPRVLEAAPEVIVLACCGYSVERTLADVPKLLALPGWQALPAVQQHRVFAVDGNAYFHRPGPRIVDSLEILAEILHPEVFADCFPRRGVVCIFPAAAGGKCV